MLRAGSGQRLHLASWLLAGSLAVLFGAQEIPPVPAAQRLTDEQRLADLLTLVEAQNSPQARRTGAGELLRLERPEVPARVATILSGTNTPAKVALALALSDYPEAFRPLYVEPLLRMLADADAEAQQAAGGALAVCPLEHVARDVQELLLDARQALHARLAAVDSLSQMTDREAIDALVRALDDPSALISEAALKAIERSAAMDFQGDLAAARAWWQQARGTSQAQWQESQIARLLRQNRLLTRRLRDLEARLNNALRDTLLRVPEGERAAVLNSYLSDAVSGVRLLGLELVQAQVVDGKTLDPHTIALVRSLLAAAEPRLRAAAVRTVASLRDPADEERFLTLLPDERQADVRRALINGLGYVGSVQSVPPLLALLAHPDRTTRDDVLTALGRLAERNMLDPAAHDAVAAALLAAHQQTPATELNTHERLLWAMGRVADPRFSGPLLAGLAAEAVPLRLTAVRGVAALATAQASNGAAASRPAGAQSQPQNDPARRAALIDALAPLAADADAGVRRAAVDALGQLAVSDVNLEALWRRLSPTSEADEQVRAAAWRGVVRVLAERPTPVIERWTERLPDDEARSRRALELLQLAESRLAGDPQRRAELGLLRARIARLRAELNQTDDALSTYLAALADLRTAGSPEAPRVAIELLRLALLADRYATELAETLSADNLGLDGRAAWEAIRGEIESRLRPDTVERALAMLAAVRANPPAAMPADVDAQIQELLAQAQAMQQVVTAIERLRRDSGDAAAREQIVALGRAAIPTLRRLLNAAIDATPPGPDEERRLYELLKAVAPDWPGYTSDAAPEAKRRALQQL